MIRSRPIVAVAAFSGALCLLPGTARAQAKPPNKVQAPSAQPASPSQRPSGSEQDRADALFLRGKAAAQAKHWEEAYDLLGQAWSLKQTYDIAGNLGQVAYLLGKHAEAAQHVSFALRHYPPTGDAEQKQKAQDLLALVRQKVSSLSARVSPRDAEVFVDGASVGRASSLPPELFVSPGERTVSAHLEGEAVERHVSAEPGGHYQLELTLGTTAIAAAPAAALSTAQPHSATHPAAEPTDTPPRESGLPNKHIALIAGGALTVGSGIALGIYASKRSKAESDMETYRTRLQDESSDPNVCADSNSKACQDLARATQDWESSSRAQNILLVLTPVLAVGTIATFFLWPDDSEDSPTTALTPVVTAEQKGMLLSGSF